MKRLFAVLLALVLTVSVIGSALAVGQEPYFWDNFELAGNLPGLLNFPDWDSLTQTGYGDIYRGFELWPIHAGDCDYHMTVWYRCVVASVENDLDGKAYISKAVRDYTVTEWAILWNVQISTTTPYTYPATIFQLRSPSGVVVMKLQAIRRDADTQIRLMCRDGASAWARTGWLPVTDSYDDEALARFYLEWYKDGVCAIRQINAETGYLEGPFSFGWLIVQPFSYKPGVFDIGIVQAGRGDKYAFHKFDMVQVYDNQVGWPPLDPILDLMPGDPPQMILPP